MSNPNVVFHSDQISGALEVSLGNVKRAAGLLGCSLQTIYKWRVRKGITKKKQLALARAKAAIEASS